MARVDNIRRRRQEVVTRVGNNDLEEPALTRMGKARREDVKDEEGLALAILVEPGCSLERQWRKMLENVTELHTEHMWENVSELRSDSH